MLGVANRAAVAIFVTCSAKVGGTTISIADCCPPLADGLVDGQACCLDLSTLDDSTSYNKADDHKLKVLYSPTTCCPSDGNWSENCTTYDVPGCMLCRDNCEGEGDLCVQCDDGLYTSTFAKPHSTGEWGPSSDGSDDLWGAFEEFVEPERGDSMATSVSPGGYSNYYSYDYTETTNEYDCSTCAWEGMSKLEKRILTDRKRSMVCDSSCLKRSGDALYGVNLCNYFNAGKGCRACCHEGHLVEGCMPCEGDGSCDTCLDNINTICKDHPCGEQCRAYLCCSMRWKEYSGCEAKMPEAMYELMGYIGEKCDTFSMCEVEDLQCSDNARNCYASTSKQRRLQEIGHEACGVLNINGAGKFDTKYALVRNLGSGITFRATDTSRTGYALQSTGINTCTGLKALSSISATNMEKIVAHSGTGYLVWGDSSKSYPQASDIGVGCIRHVWLLQDTTGIRNNVYVTVDSSVHPQHIASDWVEVHSSGEVTRSEMTLSCIGRNEENKMF